MRDRRPLVPVLLLLLALATGLRAQVDPATVAAIRKEGLESSQVMHVLDRLTNGIGQRLTGSDPFILACHWAKAEFERYGVPKVELEKWGRWPIVWNRGQWQGRVVTPEPLELQVATDAWTNGTKGLVRGPVVPLPPDSESLAAAKDHLHGAWVMGTLPSRSEPFRAELDHALDQAGILGLLFSSQGDEQYPNRMRVFGTFPRSSRIPDDPPHIMIRHDQYERIAAMLKAGSDVVAEFDVRNRWRDEPVDLYNVIAEIPGTEFPDQYVVVCGHLDSWHQATGATDNGTGVATTLEAARILMAVGAKPRRTIQFCLWGGEEQGLIGSDRHVKMHRTEMPRVSAVFNHDSGTNWAQSLTVTPAQATALQPVIAPLLDLPCPDPDFDGPVFELKTRPQLIDRGGSDHASFVSAGVPAFPWHLRGRADYFHYSWHSQWDTFDAAIPEYLRHTSTVVALMALGTANLPDLLPRQGVAPARGDDLQPQVEAILGVDLDGPNDLHVKSITANGLAAKIGIRAGDLIVGVAGETVHDLLGVRRGLRRPSGDEAGGATIAVMRGDQRLEIALQPGTAAGAK